MKKIIIVIFIIIFIAIWNYFISENIITFKLKDIKDKVNKIETSVWNLEKWQTEILKKIGEIQSKLIDIEITLSNIENQNKYTQYLIERNWLDIKYVSKTITNEEYYNWLINIKNKYINQNEIKH